VQPPAPIVLQAPPTPTLSSPLPVPMNSFKQQIKVNLTDYPQLKEDSKWRLFNRHLRATAASHGTLDVLNPEYVPSTPEESLLFDQKQKFMYNVFCKHINTAKGKICVRSESESMDAQAVYILLTEAYGDSLSSRLDATNIRTYIINMKLDDKWRTGYEAFLNHWTTKLQELEVIEDKEVDGDTRRIWLSSALQSHREMDSAIRQAITTELTISGMTKAAKDAQVSWDNFYNIVLSTAKMLDNTRSQTAKSKTRQANQTSTSNKSSGRGNGGRGRNSGRGNSGRGTNSDYFKNLPKTPYTGPNMTLRADMYFTPEDWAKMTDTQKTKLRELKQKAKQAKANTTASAYNTNSTIVQPTELPATAPTNNIRSLLSNAMSRDAATIPQQVTYGGRTYTLSSSCIHYNVNTSQGTPCGALIDGGANGGMSGADVRVLSESLDSANVSGIGDKAIPNLPLCTVAALIQSHKGPIIGIFHQYAHYGRGHTIHSVNQLKSFGIQVDDNPRRFGFGKQQIITPDGYVIPISIRNGLPHIDMSPPTDQELDSYPHVFFTSDVPWDPSVLDDEYCIDDVQVDGDDVPPSDYHPNLNDYGELYAVEPDDVYNFHMELRQNKHIVQPKQHDFVRLLPNFGFTTPERIQKTIENTTQFARMDTRLPLRKHFKSRFPAANVHRLNETVATDTFFFDIPALDDGIMGHGGSTMLQLYCGVDSLLTAVFPMRSETEMAGTLEDFIRTYGAPNSLFSDNAKAQIGRAVQEILRMYAIHDFQCEPHHQHQNFAERRIQEVKKIANNLLDRTGSPANLWLLCVQYVIYILNRLSTESLQWKTPLEVATGQQPDISAILAFRWYEPVYFKSYTSSFPSQPQEKTWSYRWVCHSSR